jgi:hypothetical protein
VRGWWQRGRPAEVYEQAVAEILGDVAAEPRDRAGRGLLVLRDDLAPLFGVALLRERRRADQVAEQNRQMAPFTGGCGAGCLTCQSSWVGRGCGLAEGRAAFAAKVGRRGGSASHFAQCFASAFPHFAQKLLVEGLFVPHFEQVLTEPKLDEAMLASADGESERPPVGGKP